MTLLIKLHMTMAKEYHFDADKKKQWEGENIKSKISSIFMKRDVFLFGIYTHFL